MLYLAPKTARRIAANGADEEVALDAVAVGDSLRLPRGEVLEDGEVIERRSSVGESMVTGTDVAIESAGITLLKADRHLLRPEVLTGNHAQYPPETFLRVHLQRGGRADFGRRSVACTIGTFLEPLLAIGLM